MKLRRVETPQHYRKRLRREREDWRGKPVPFKQPELATSWKQLVHSGTLEKVDWSAAAKGEFAALREAMVIQQEAVRLWLRERLAHMQLTGEFRLKRWGLVSLWRRPRRKGTGWETPALTVRDLSAAGELVGELAQEFGWAVQAPYPPPRPGDFGVEYELKPEFSKVVVR